VVQNVHLIMSAQIGRQKYKLGTISWQEELNWYTSYSLVSSSSPPPFPC